MHATTKGSHHLADDLVNNDGVPFNAVVTHVSQTVVPNMPFWLEK